MNRNIIHRGIPSIIEGFFNPLTEPADSIRIPVNISEEENNLEIELALPGFGKDDLDLNLDENNLLRIEGKIQATSESKTKINRRREFSLKPFSKSFRLGKGLDKKGIKASFLNGILRISIPKISREARKESVTIPLS